MALRGIVGSSFMGSSCKPERWNVIKAGRVSKVVSVQDRRHSKEQRRVCLRASSSSYQSVDKINGVKINGREAPSLGRSSELVKENNEDVPIHALKLGRFVEGQFVYRQIFVIRSYEIGPDKTATMETLMNLLQETALNHVKGSGLAGDGFGATREMSIRKLIWVVTRIHIQVEKYSSWGDIVQIETWVDAAGKNGMRRDWVIRDYNTQQVITRATSTWVIMNRETRKLSKIPDEVRKEVKPFYLNRRAIAEEASDNNKIDKLSDETAESIRSGLAPRWSDMDANQHVNNVKYIGWILESVPVNVLADYYLTSMTLEYRRECRQSHLLESMTSMKRSAENDSGHAITCTERLGSTHLLCMQEDRVEIIRARAEWRCKRET